MHSKNIILLKKKKRILLNQKDTNNKSIINYKMILKIAKVFSIIYDIQLLTCIENNNIKKNRQEKIVQRSTCGGLMTGVLKRLPQTPPFDIVNVPPAISSIDMEPSFAFLARVLISFSISAKFIFSALRITGTTRPLNKEFDNGQLNVDNLFNVKLNFIRLKAHVT